LGIDLDQKDAKIKTCDVFIKKCGYQDPERTGVLQVIFRIRKEPVCYK